MRKQIDPALLDLRDLHRFTDHEMARVQNAEAIHRAMMAKNLGNEVFKIIVMNTKGEPLGVVQEDDGHSRFFINGEKYAQNNVE